jgi:hypothetical protein
MPETDTPPDTPPTDCGCDSGPFNAAAGTPGLSCSDAFSEAPVRYFDGTVQLNWNDLSSAGFGGGWGHSRSWSNTQGYAARDFSGNPMGYNGNGTVVPQLPFALTNASFSTAIVVTSGTNARFFDNVNGPNPTARFFVQDTLTHANGEFVVADTAGDQIHFNDFTGAPFNPRWGRFTSMTDPAGNVTAVTSWTADGKPAEVQRTTPPGQSPRVVESYLYRYVPSGVNRGLFSNVTLRRQTDGGPWAVVRQVDYSYYETGEAHGNPNDLKTAVVKDGAGNILDTSYYRYYPNAGSFDGLKYVFNPQSYARLAAAVGDPLAATDDQVAPYADNYFEYDPLRRVTKEIAQGTNCGCTGLPGDYTFSYSTSSNAPGYNSWRSKTIETLPDNTATNVSRNVVYCNSYGEVMLKVYESGAPGSTQQWETFYQYDAAGRVVLTADASALSGYDEARPDLLNRVGGHYQYLRDDVGRVELTDYYASTTATETTPGGVAGYYQDTKLQRGQLGTPVLQASKQYFARATRATGAVDVTVTGPGGTSAVSAADRFTYATPAAPAVTGLSLTSGSVVGGATLAVTGTGFTGASAVLFNTTPADGFYVLSDTAIEVYNSPAHAAGPVDVRVTGPGGTSAPVAADRFTYLTPAAPAVTGLSLTSGSVVGGATLAVTGTGFTGASAVFFNTTPAGYYSFSDTAISVRVPAHAAGPVDVRVTTPGGTSAPVAADRFTYLTPAAPAVSGLSPPSGLVAGGATVTLVGAGFTGASAVLFGTVQVTSFTESSDTSIRVTAPAQGAGAVDVRVVGPGGTSATSPADRFTYVTGTVGYGPVT